MYAATNSLNHHYFFSTGFDFLKCQGLMIYGFSLEASILGLVNEWMPCFGLVVFSYFLAVVVPTFIHLQTVSDN